MDNILIHVGYHKTGTTWLQTELFVRDSPFFAPLTSRKAGCSTIAEDFFYDQNGYLLNSFDMNEKTIIKSLDELLKSEYFNTSKIPIMSHERLSGSPHSAGFDSSVISKRLLNIFPKTKIFIMIREQSEIILSTYFQYLAAGGNHSLQKYLKTQYDGKRPGFSPGHFEFHHLIKDFQNRFSKDKILVIPYELFNSDKTAFFQILGDFLEIDLSKICSNLEVRLNSHENPFIEYQFRWIASLIRSSSLNNYSNLNNEFSMKMILRLKNLLSYTISTKKNKNLKEKLHKEVKEWMGVRFNESNKITEQLIGRDLQQYGYQTIA